MEAAKSAGLAAKDDDGDLVDRADALAKALKAPSAQFADLAGAVDGTWAAMQKASVTVEPSKRVVGPPTLAKPLRAADLGEGAALSTTSFAFAGIQVSPYAGDVIHLLVQDASVPRAPFVCAIGDGPIRCRSLPGELGKGSMRVAVFGTAEKGAAPLLLAGQDGEHGVYRSDTGAKVSDDAPLGGSIAADGTIRLLRQDGERLVLEERAPGETKGRMAGHPLPRGCDTFGASVLWDQGVVECRLVGRGMNRSNDWLLLPLGKDPPGMGDEAAPDGEDAPGEPATPVVRPGGVRSCRAGTTLVAAFQRSILFFDGLAWTRPQTSASRGGGVTCGDKIASVTFLAQAGGDTPWRSEIGHLRCTVAACAQTNVEFERLLRGGLEGAPRGKLFDAASLGDQMLVVWASGESGGVRLRLGAPDAVVAGRDVVVYDDRPDLGEPAATSDLLELVALGQPAQATLLLRTSRGVHAVRVAAGGGYAPAEVVWESAAAK